MRKSELVACLSDHAGISRQQGSEFLNGLRDLAVEELRGGEAFTLPGFGKFTVIQRGARLGRNVRTGESIEIPARKAVRFRVSRPFQADCCD